MRKAGEVAIAEARQGDSVRGRGVGLLILLGAIALILGGVGGYYGGHWRGFNAGAKIRRQLPSGATACRPGPWGDLAYTPVMIAAPDDLLPVKTLESRGAHWFFKGYTEATFTQLLTDAGLGADARQAMLADGVFELRTNGVMVTPPASVVLGLPADARARLYGTLARFEEDAAEVFIIKEADAAGMFATVEPGTLDLFHKLSTRTNGFYVFSGLSAALSQIADAGEKLHFVKALTSRQTVTLKLHVTPKTDLVALAEYWGKSTWGTDANTIFQSLSSIPDGTWMNIMMVMPALPTQEIYDYPTMVDDPEAGPPVERNSEWSSLNFFRDTAEPQFGEMDAALAELRENYAPAAADPRYGDVVILSKPDGSLVHTAVYIADDICFSKDGDTVLTPWVLETVPDMVARYSFRMEPGQSPVVYYFRNKRL